MIAPGEVPRRILHAHARAGLRNVRWCIRLAILHWLEDETEVSAAHTNLALGCLGRAHECREAARALGGVERSRAGMRNLHRVFGDLLDLDESPVLAATSVSPPTLLDGDE